MKWYDMPLPLPLTVDQLDILKFIDSECGGSSSGLFDVESGHFEAESALRNDE